MAVFPGRGVVHGALVAGSGSRSSDDEWSYAVQAENLNLRAPPDLGAFCRLDGLGLKVVRQRLEADRAVLACRVRPSELDR